MPKILISGGAGSIGSELCRQLALKNEIYTFDINETGFFDLYEEQKLMEAPIRGRVGDIRDRLTVEAIFDNIKPEIVYHAAALKHVAPCEHNPREPAETNIMGTLNMIDAAKKHGVKKFVFISTDKVVNANSVMGVSKRFCELAVKNAGYINVRFGNVMGSRGSVIPFWQKQIDQGRPITITDPQMERFMMTIEEAVDLVIQAGEMGQGGETIVLDMGKKINILELAKEIIAKSGRDIPIKTIGIRPGETLTEKLFYDEEEKRAEKKGNFWVVKG